MLRASGYSFAGDCALRTECALGNPARIGDKPPNDARNRAQFDVFCELTNLGSARSDLIIRSGEIPLDRMHVYQLAKELLAIILLERERLIRPQRPPV